MNPVDLPSTAFGPQKVPAVFLGDNGFIHGPHIPAAELQRLMRIATCRVAIGLSGGTAHVLRTARKVQPIHAGAVMYHTDLRPSLAGKPFPYRRMLSTICERLKGAHSRFLDEDDLAGHFYRKFGGFSPCSKTDSLAATLNSKILDAERNLIDRQRPNLVSVGGDWIDFLGAIGRGDLVVEGLQLWRSWCDQAGLALLLTTYTGPQTLLGLEPEIAPLIDGLLITENAAGRGMFPNKLAFQSWVNAFGKPVMAMHALGIGRVSPSDALTYVFEHSQASAVVIGASRPSTITTLCDSLVDHFTGVE